MILIVDNGGANLASVTNALARLGRDAFVSGDPADLDRADRVIVPGVGAAAPAMQRLAATGMDAALVACTKPVLGICLGMQLLFEQSGEGEVACLGILPGRVTRFDGGARVPHMGWSTTTLSDVHPLWNGIADGEWFYYVHSYRADINGHTVAVCDHDAPFAAAVARANFAGVQFHPERSGPAGARLIENFIGWHP
ncbi:MAG: imidazole glycerol phosphate synthase subunit HisH [Xanthomonadaceae bacterium]|nr:imidazole glycerol phosphate synthase subunit HisH [Xanthomonadaceae bacterium]